MATAQNYIALNFIGSKQTSNIESLMHSLFQYGCSIAQAHVKTMGTHVNGMILASGTWNAIAKLEAGLPQLSERLNLLFLSRRTEQTELPTKKAVTYTVQATASDRSGLTHLLVRFFIERGIGVSEVHTHTYPDFRTHVSMFSLNAIVEIYDSVHLGRLREEFMIYCDEHNIDALLEPLKSMP